MFAARNSSHRPSLFAIAALAIGAVVLGPAVSVAAATTNQVKPEQTIAAEATATVVPKLVGKAAYTAKNMLKKIGLRYTYSTPKRTSVVLSKEWTVTKQSPKALSKVKAGTKVKLTVVKTSTLRATRAHFTAGDPGDPATVTPSSESASVVIADNSVTDTEATALLATLPIKGKAPKTGYSRTGDFGTAWLDVDRNGCDTRNDILARDLSPERRQGSCKVLAGVLDDPYTGKTISFTRGQSTSALVQIDHVVALSNAWQTGAQQLSQAQRISLANDPLNLLAVDGRSNSQKGDGDTATWLPSNKSFRCSYVAHQISVKATYGLWVTQAEHDAMVRVLSDCSGERALTSTFAPAPAPAPVVVVPAPAPAPARPAPAPAPARPAPAPARPAPAPARPAPAPAGAYYANCTAVRAAGAAPLHAGQPGYSRKLDRDGDGIACE